MATRWMVVCDADVQPVLVSGDAMDCAGASGTASVIPVDTVIQESSPLAGLGQLMSMTTDDALVIGAAIGLLWALAWGLRQIARSIDIRSSKDESQDD